MAINFQQSSLFNEIRIRIEQHLFDSVFELEKSEEAALRSVAQFAESIERLMDTLDQMYQTPDPKNTLGEKSFPIREGRYRVFYKVSIGPSSDFTITFLDIDDNKQSNFDRFPNHRIITFDDES
jgi:hypothetical protein